MALTAQGKVVIWGKIGGPADRRVGRPEVAEIMGLPPIISIAAGQSHALMTDGERVWALGRSDILLTFACLLSTTCRHPYCIQLGQPPPSCVPCHSSPSSVCAVVTPGCSMTMRTTASLKPLGLLLPFCQCHANTVFVILPSVALFFSLPLLHDCCFAVCSLALLTLPCALVTNRRHSKHLTMSEHVLHGICCVKLPDSA